MSLDSDFRKVLALDTAMSGCNVAVYDVESDSGVSKQVPMVRGQAEALVPLIQDVLAEGKLSFEDIDLIATTIGPGAFTGLRIGLSTAKSLGLALDVPVVGLSTLEVLAQCYLQSRDPGQNEKCAVLIETKREDFYFQLFDSEGGALSQPQAIAGTDVLEQMGDSSVVLVGDALARFSSLVDTRSAQIISSHDIGLPDPVVMATMALSIKDQEDPNNQKRLEPLYLRNADVSSPKVPPRVLVEN